MDEPKRRGRPPKTGEKVSDYPIFTFAPDAETLDLMKRAAEDMGVPLGTWARITLTKQVREWAREQGLL
jgi:hypothetical protein